MGAAFSTAGGEAAEEGGVIAPRDGLDFLAGVPIPPGGAIGSVLGTGEVLAVVGIAPIPLPRADAGLALLGLAGHGGARSTGGETRP